MSRERDSLYERHLQLALDHEALKLATRRMLRALDGYEAAAKRKQQAHPGDPESYVEAGGWMIMWNAAFEVYRFQVEQLLGKP